jgi:hypothetical protein
MTWSGDLREMIERDMREAARLKGAISHEEPVVSSAVLLVRVEDVVRPVRKRRIVARRTS